MRFKVARSTPIGQFIENYEHTSTRKHEFPSNEMLEELLGSSFEAVTRDKIIHITLYLARKS